MKDVKYPRFDSKMIGKFPFFFIYITRNVNLMTYVNFEFARLVQGFPGSVTPDYVPFQIWDSLQVVNPSSFESFHSSWSVIPL